MSRWIHGFSGSESITIITYFDAQNVPDLVTGSSFGLASVLFWDISCHSLSTFFFFGEGTRIHSYGTRWSSLPWTLSALGLDSTISVKNPGSLVRVILEHKIWKLGVLLATEVSWLVTAFSVDRLGEMAMSSCSCLSPFYICSSFLSLWEQWVPRLVYHSSAQF